MFGRIGLLAFGTIGTLLGAVLFTIGVWGILPIDRIDRAGYAIIVAPIVWAALMLLFWSDMRASIRLSAVAGVILVGAVAAGIETMAA